MNIKLSVEGKQMIFKWKKRAQLINNHIRMVIGMARLLIKTHFSRDVILLYC